MLLSGVQRRLTGLALGPDPKARVEHSWIFFVVLFLTMAIIPWMLIRSQPFSTLALPEPVKGARFSPAKRVVIFLVDGLSANFLYDPGIMPGVHTFAPSSAWGRAPSLGDSSSVSLRAAFCGHPQILQMMARRGQKPLEEFDSIFSRASEAGLKSFIVGQSDGSRLFSGQATEIRTVIFQGREPIYDEQVFNEAAKILRNHKDGWHILALHFFEADITNPNPQNALKKMLWLDRHIREIADLAGKDSTFVLLGTHARAHGSGEESDVPILLWGKKIRAGRIKAASQEDLAPTLAALLGLPPPILTQSRPLWEALELAPEQKADVMLDLLEQRHRRWRALKSMWPWLANAPSEAVQRVAKVQVTGDPMKISHAAELAVRLIDDSMKNASPVQWMRTLIFVLWTLIFAAAFALIWPLVRRGSRNLSVMLGVVAVEALACTVSFPGVWHVAIAVALSCSLILLFQAAVPGLARPGLAPFDWVVWWLAIFGLAFPTVLDPWIWSWIAIWLAVFERFLDASPDERNVLCAAFLILTVSTVLSAWSPISESSLVRNCFPDIPVRKFLRPPWEILAPAMIAVQAVIFRKRADKISEIGEGRKTLLFRLGTGPLIASEILLRVWGPAAAPFTWVLILACTIWAFNLAHLDEDRGLLLSLMSLAFFRSVSTDTEFVLLSLAALAGWVFAWIRGTANPLRQGLIFTGLFLWSYMLVNSQLNFSQFSPERGHQIVTALKQVAVLSAATLPVLVDLPFRGLMAALLPLGALSAGCISELWFDYAFYRTAMENLTNDALFEKALFVILLSCLMVVLWALARLLRVGFKAGVIYEIT